MPESVSEETRQLRRTMRDLVALSMLPAVWTGYGPEAIAQSLADVLLSTLSLDLIYIQLQGYAGEEAVEVARSRLQPDLQPQAVADALHPSLNADVSGLPVSIPNPVGGGNLRIAITRFGYTADCGVLVAGSQRSDFPTEAERLLLGVGANQTAIVVQRKRAERALDEQREWLRVTLASIGDAVLTTDTLGRVTFLNAVAQSLTGWAQQEAEGRPLEEVFRIVNEQSRQPVEHPVEKVLAKGKIVGLANNTVLIARDGTERPVDDSAAPIRDGQGNIVGVVLVFRDVTERRRAEQQLRRSERELADFFENATVGLHWVGPDGIILRANRTELDLLGYSPDEYIGHHIAEFHADKDVIEDILRRLQAGEELQEYEARLRCKDGTIRHVVINSNVLWEDEQFVHTRCFTRDITERKRAQSLLACQKQALEMVAEGTPLVKILDFLVRTIEEESTGMVAAIHLLDQSGSYFRQAIAPGLPESYHRATGIAVHSDQGPCCRAVSSRQAVTVSDISSDPQWAAFAELAVPLGLFSCWSTPIFSSVGKVLGTFANYYPQPGDPSPQDRQLVEIVTRTAAVAIEHVQAGESLRESEQTARFLAEASADLAELTDYKSTLQKVASIAVPTFADWCTVDLLDADGTLRRLAVTHTDPAKVRLAQELLERYPLRPDEPHGVPQVARTGKAELVEDIPDSLVASLAHDEEHLRILRELGLKSYVCVPMQSKGRTLGVLTFVMAETGRRYNANALLAAEDLADRAAVAVENAQLYGALREADRRKDEFLATLAHELRNPLAPLRNALQIMKLSGEGQATAQVRGMMERQLQQVVRLVDDLLDVSRITRGKIELRKERLAVAMVVQTAQETSRPLIEAAHHELTVTLPSETLLLDGDPARLAQVVSNLLNNAAKYTPEGGRIWLTVERSDGEAVIRVRDNGTGIPANMLPKIWEMFTQVDRTLERAQGGLGIGLTLVRRLVEMHGGSVEAFSAGTGRGSTFTVRLPLAQVRPERPQAEGEPGEGQQAPASARRRILVVDDNVDSAQSLALLLQLTGNEVRTAYDGPSALEVAAAFVPDVVLLDIGLPGMNGLDVARRMRAMPQLRGTVLIAQTGWGQQEDRRRSEEAGFNVHLVKPVDLAELQAVLATLGDTRK